MGMYFWRWMCGRLGSPPPCMGSPPPCRSCVASTYALKTDERNCLIFTKYPLKIINKHFSWGSLNYLFILTAIGRGQKLTFVVFLSRLVFPVPLLASCACDQWPETLPINVGVLLGLQLPGVDTVSGSYPESS